MAMPSRFVSSLTSGEDWGGSAREVFSACCRQAVSGGGGTASLLVRWHAGVGGGSTSSRPLSRLRRRVPCFC